MLKKKLLHIAFLDLQKAFNFVSRRVVWWALRFKGVPEAYVDVIEDMFFRSKSLIRTAFGVTKPFPFTMEVQQPPWVFMYADV